MKKSLNQHKVGDLWSLGLPNGIDVNFLNLQGDSSNFNCALHDSLSTKLIKKIYGCEVTFRPSIPGSTR
jgi:hypothetical protein